MLTHETHYNNVKAGRQSANTCVLKYKERATTIPQKSVPSSLVARTT